MDRNLHSRNGHNVNREVALRKESVDRNMYRLNCHLTDDLSLSARRAWIEIWLFWLLRTLVGVALRKESVDRNLGTMQIVIIVVESLSARRAWIEILQKVF